MVVPVAAAAIPVVIISAAAGSNASAARFRLQWKRFKVKHLAFRPPTGLADGLAAALVSQYR
jgi:hypothetical protein